MLTETLVRGADIHWAATFTDALGVAIIPAGATLSLAYRVEGVLTKEDHAMTMDGGLASFTWNSAVADRGAVEWCINTTGVTKAANEGLIMLEANAANPLT